MEPRDIPEGILTRGSNDLANMLAVDAGLKNPTPVEMHQIREFAVPTTTTVIMATYEPIRRQAWNEAADKLAEAGLAEAANVVRSLAVESEIAEGGFDL